MIVIDNVYYFPNPELADAKSAEKDWQKRGMYTGPPFGNLDEDLQVLLERYLDERGVNTHLALFVPDYIDFKEQREYLRWLSSKLSPSLAYSSILSAFQLILHRCQVVCRSIRCTSSYWRHRHFVLIFTVYSYYFHSACLICNLVHSEDVSCEIE